MTDDLDAQTLASAHRMFDLARGGATEELAEYVDAGLPVDMTNDKGDTLLARGAHHARTNDRGQTALAAAVFRKNTEAVRALLDAGAEPDHGSPSAVETARFFELPEMLAALGRS
ncbi:ankyrin repeat domain-containing protein [Micromonospora sp. 4G57]|uniref:Ankyrin repeat domain-containing protein n=1 Tax=Micromonospora sicca TaxID=2202420 RepID=A0ABU5JHA4_9ACTN|nr:MULTISPECIES: ankyrin repeat domain-containing protein [unclassified Micromonospora]MDZ5446153.1 ankyrin repeat domain-containing protein [Micromonospora sp. 4G57]MDZ5491963.1 ankyrin repeat domain-containing protein [Micromonospora sp. 4G53]